MIKLKPILLEGLRSKEISENEMYSYIESVPTLGKKIASKLLKGNFIHRGLRVDNKRLYIEPKLFNRVSKNTDNFYTLLIDNFPTWENYPKRSRSIVCSTSEDKADVYGNVYAVFPIDMSAQFGVCSSQDIWLSFKSIGRLNELNSDISLLGTLISNKPDLTSEENNIISSVIYSDKQSLTYNNLINFFSFVDKNKSFYINQGYSHLSNFMIHYMDSNVSLYDYLLVKMKPDVNGFSLLNYYDDNTRLPDNREVWTDSSCLLINEDIASYMNIEFIRKLEELS